MKIKKKENPLRFHLHKLYFRFFLIFNNLVIFVASCVSSDFKKSFRR